MPPPSFIKTPEQLLGRNDSKNPSTTCRGITTSGRPCRRALAVSRLMTSRVNNEDGADDGVVAVVHTDDQLANAHYFCWQHKDQVRDVLPELPARPARRSKHEHRTEVLQLRNRNSINSLMHTLNIQSNEKGGLATLDRPHSTTQVDPVKGKPDRATAPRQPSAWRSLCCMLAADDDDDTIEIVRHKHRIERGRNSAATPARLPVTTKPPSATARPKQANLRDQVQLSSLIAPGTSPQTAVSLLAELAKPISQHDERGYIYIFWLTPSSHSAPTEETATTILAPNRPRDRRLSDVMSDFSLPSEQQTSATTTSRKIMLKIGRANNVTRRLSEWQRQCGYQLSLIRWYPYMSQDARKLASRSSEKTIASTQLYPDLSQHERLELLRNENGDVNKVPHVRRVERLIHLELNEQQAKRQCSICGREHREWFMIDATETGIRRVDEVIRRWVRWSQSQ